jgi:AraC-like DNA-binding protein
MAHFLSYLPDPVMRARLNEAVKMEYATKVSHKVEHVDSWKESYQIARRSTPHLVIFDPYASGKLDVESCASFSAAFSSTVLFAYGDFGRTPARDTLRLARAGVQEVAEYGVSDSPVALSLLLTDALTSSLIGGILAALDNRLTPETLRLVQYILSCPDDQITPEHAAKVCYCHPKTLREHLRKAGLPSTQRLIAWVRLFSAAYLLQDPARSVENVALRLGFPSVNAFRNQLRRYAEVGPRELLKKGGVQYLLRKFMEHCPDGS